MSILKGLCTLGIITGLVLVCIATLVPLWPAVSLALAGIASVFMTVSAYFYSFLKDEEKQVQMAESHRKQIKDLELAHQNYVMALKRDLDETCEGELLKQYALDTVEMALVRDALNEIRTYVTAANTGNGQIIPAVLSAMLNGIERAQTSGFYGKVTNLRGKTAQDGHGRALVARFRLFLAQLRQPDDFFGDFRRGGFRKSLWGLTRASPDPM